MRLWPVAVMLQDRASGLLLEPFGDELGERASLGEPLGADLAAPFLGRGLVDEPRLRIDHDAVDALGNVER